MNTNILIVEDDIDLGNLLKLYLELNNFTTHRVYNGEEARLELQKRSFDILIIDVMMPKEDGFELAETLRVSFPGLPFLFVTARKMKEDILRGLKLGADDYILKPFDADELVLRIKNILKRTQKFVENIEKIITIGIFRFYPEDLVLISPSVKKSLTEKESKLLLYLYQHKNQLIKRNHILDHLWKEADFFNGRSMDVFISKLRKYLVEDPSIRIESMRGVGFWFYC